MYAFRIHKYFNIYVSLSNHFILTMENFTLYKDIDKILQSIKHVVIAVLEIFISVFKCICTLILFHKLLSVLKLQILQNYEY